MIQHSERPGTRSPEEVVAVLAQAAVQGRFPHWVDGLAVLAAFDAHEWLLADHLSRRRLTTKRERQLWGAANLGEPSGFVAVVAGWQPDPHLREVAVEVLAEHRGPVIASALAVRLLDPVPRVREAAVDALRQQPSADTVDRLLAVLAAARPSSRADRAQELVTRFLPG